MLRAPYLIIILTTLLGYRESSSNIQEQPALLFLRGRDINLIKEFVGSDQSISSEHYGITIIFNNLDHLQEKEFGTLVKKIHFRNPSAKTQSEYFDNEILLINQLYPSDSSILKELIFTNRKNKIVADLPGASFQFFRKIAYSLVDTNQKSEERKAEINEVNFYSGCNLLNLPLVFIQVKANERITKMLSASLQNPGDYVIGIDDSTMISIRNRTIRVYGRGQLFLLEHPEPQLEGETGYAVAKNLSISVFLPGDSVKI